MIETGWQAIGRLARQRRERMGLRQDELSARGGPGVATVGKFERAAQARFAPATQHQIEAALGWEHGTVQHFVEEWDFADGQDAFPDWQHELIEGNLPAMGGDAEASPERISALSAYVHAFESLFSLVDPDLRDAALRAALLALMRYVRGGDDPAADGSAGDPGPVDDRPPLLAAARDVPRTGGKADARAADERDTGSQDLAPDDMEPR